MQSFAPLPGFVEEKCRYSPVHLEHNQTCDSLALRSTSSKSKFSPPRPKDPLYSPFSLKVFPGAVTSYPFPLHSTVVKRVKIRNSPKKLSIQKGIVGDFGEEDGKTEEMKERHDYLREGRAGWRLKTALHRRRRLVVDQNEVFTIRRVLKAPRPHTTNVSASRDHSLSEPVPPPLAALFHNESIRDWGARLLRTSEAHI